jgi:hypothetical protein
MTLYVIPPVVYSILSNYGVAKIYKVLKNQFAIFKELEKQNYEI